MIELLKGNSRLAASIVVVIILVVLDVMFLMQWRSAEDNLESVETERKVAEVSLTNARAQYDLTELRSQEAELSGGPEFPTAIPIVDLSVFLADGAALSQVGIKRVDPPARIGTEKLGGTEYPAYETKVAVSGSLTQLIAYLKYIEGGSFTSARIEDVSCSSGEQSWDCSFTLVVISQI